MKRIKVIILFFILLNIPTLSAMPEWTALFYVQANNNLSPFALKNFSDMASIGSNENLNALVQWYQPNHHGVWRYKVEKGKLVLDECHPVQSDGSTTADLVDSMRWAVTKYPAAKYSLILWNHGLGIMDPIWGKQRQGNNREIIAINQEILALSPRIQIDGLTTDQTVTFTKQLDETLSTTYNRGILFNEESKTYMDNHSLTQALHTIKKDILNNKKIDLLGMDACLMAMVEVGYLARDYANTFVASQEVELAHGWNYQALMQSMSLKNSSASHVAHSIVKSYEAYYKDKIQFYTQSAINLDHMVGIKANIDKVVAAFKACQQADKATVTQLAKNARKNCIQFSTSSYVDLHTFYAEFHKQVLANTSASLKKSRSFDDLKQHLASGMTLIEKSIIVSTAGKNFPGAKGLSIYFPLWHVDASYPKTDFAKDGLWHGFIKELAGN